MNWLDTKYIGLMSFKLQRFKKIGEGYNFRCPLCGDSKKSATKTRAWFYYSRKTDSAKFHCHNCSASMGLGFFIKKIDPTLYYEYVKDLILEKNGGEKHPTHEFADKMKPPVFVKDTALKELRKISHLEAGHPALLYVEKRKIPKDFHYKLFFAPKFKAWTNGIIPGKFDAKFDEPRLIIPFLDKDKKLFGFQGRSFKKNDPLKYITIMMDENKPKLFGLDDVDERKMVYVTEGPIDSMFIPNAISSAGGRLETNLQFTNIRKDDTVLIYDNEPRSPETVKKIAKSVDDGWKVCIWPESYEQKDINDGVMSGLSPEDITSMIKDNTFSGLTAHLRLSTWRKC